MKAREIRPGCTFDDGNAATAYTVLGVERFRTGAGDDQERTVVVATIRRDAGGETDMLEWYPEEDVALEPPTCDEYNTLRQGACKSVLNERGECPASGAHR